MGIAQSTKCASDGKVFGLMQQHAIFAINFKMYFRAVDDDEKTIAQYIHQNRISMVHNPMRSPENVADSNGWTHLPCGGFGLFDAPNHCIEIFPVYSYHRLSSGILESHLRHYFFTTQDVKKSLTIPLSTDPPSGLFSQTMEWILTQPQPKFLSNKHRDAWIDRKNYSREEPTELRFSQLRAVDGRLYQCAGTSIQPWENVQVSAFGQFLLHNLLENQWNLQKTKVRLSEKASYSLFQQIRLSNGFEILVVSSNDPDDDPRYGNTMCLRLLYFLVQWVGRKKSPLQSLVIEPITHRDGSMYIV